MTLLVQKSVFADLVPFTREGTRNNDQVMTAYNDTLPRRGLPSSGSKDRPRALGAGCRAPAMAGFARELEGAGLAAEDIAYLSARGVSTKKLLARIAKTDEDFESKIVDPYLHGKDIGETTHKPSRSPTIVRAALMVAFDDAKKPDDAAQASQASQPAGSDQQAQAAKVPTALRKGQWRLNVERWQDQWEPPRVFNEEMIYGADEALARLDHEAAVSKAFTLLKLGELTATRSWKADGELNREAEKHKRKKADKVDITVNDVPISLGTSSEADFALSGWWAMYDDFDAQSWALRWAKYGTDEEIDKWISFWQLECRNRSLTTAALGELFEATTCQVTTRMTKGSTFGDAVKEVLTDTDGWLAKYKGTVRTRAIAKNAGAPAVQEPLPGAHPKSRADSRGDKRRERQWEEPPPRAEDRSKKPKKATREDRASWRANACHNWQVGRCNFKGCRYAHECAICGLKEHKAPACNYRR